MYLYQSTFANFLEDWQLDKWQLKVSITSSHSPSKIKVGAS